MSKRHYKFIGTSQPVEVYENKNGSIHFELLIPEFINSNINFKNETK